MATSISQGRSLLGRLRLTLNAWRAATSASVTLWSFCHESLLGTSGAGAGASLCAFQGTWLLGLSPPCRQGPDDRWDVFLAASDQGHEAQDEEH